VLTEEGAMSADRYAAPDSMRDRFNRIEMPSHHRQRVIADYDAAARLVDAFHYSVTWLATQLFRGWNRVRVFVPQRRPGG
jgi:hypothetical protein